MITLLPETKDIKLAFEHLLNFSNKQMLHLRLLFSSARLLKMKAYWYAINSQIKIKVLANHIWFDSFTWILVIEIAFKLEALTKLTIEFILALSSILLKSLLVIPGNILLNVEMSFIDDKFWVAKTVLLYDLSYASK